jgi:hypothetical protein
MEGESMTRRKLAARVGVASFELSALAFDTFRVPRVGKYQEKLVRKAYANAGKLADRAGLPHKRYARINSRGEIEQL